MKEKKLWISFGVFIVLCLITQVLGSIWTRETVSTWYPTLVKPAWTPPGWLFGPVWTVLYVMIAFSGWFIYRAESSPNRTLALVFYGIQLALNFIWSFLFFSLQSPLLGLIDIVLLCIFISLTIVKAFPLTRLGSLLLVPYLIWVLYATSLNAGIWVLMPRVIQGSVNFEIGARDFDQAQPLVKQGLFCNRLLDYEGYTPRVIQGSV
jgi:tryptophan-rich sensory protein